MKAQILLQKGSYHFRNLAKEFAWNVGLGKSLLKPRPGARILLYHGIDHNGRLDHNRRFISQSRFWEEMTWLAKNAYVVPLSEYFEGKYPKDRLAVALTFDDGYLNNYTLAAPILVELKLPATFFISTPQVQGQNYLWPDALDLTLAGRKTPITIQETQWVPRRDQFIHPQTGQSLKTWAVWGGKNSRLAVEKACGTQFQDNPADRIYWELVTPLQIQELASEPLFEIGAHSVVHDNYATLSPAEIQSDLEISTAWLQNITGNPIQSLAYPFGAFSQATQEIATKKGIPRLLALDAPFQSLANGQSKQFGRLGNNPLISFRNQISVYIAGKY